MLEEGTAGERRQQTLRSAWRTRTEGWKLREQARTRHTSTTFFHNLHGKKLLSLKMLNIFFSTAGGGFIGWHTPDQALPPPRRNQAEAAVSASASMQQQQQQQQGLSLLARTQQVLQRRSLQRQQQQALFQKQVRQTAAGAGVQQQELAAGAAQRQQQQPQPQQQQQQQPWDPATLGREELIKVVGMLREEIHTKDRYIKRTFFLYKKKSGI